TVTSANMPHAMVRPTADHRPSLVFPPFLQSRVKNMIDIPSQSGFVVNFVLVQLRHVVHRIVLRPMEQRVRLLRLGSYLAAVKEEEAAEKEARSQKPEASRKQKPGSEGQRYAFFWLLASGYRLLSRTHFTSPAKSRL